MYDEGFWVCKVRFVPNDTSYRLRAMSWLGKLLPRYREQI